jgi:pseudouridine-5'-phosphate glycosidase
MDGDSAQLGGVAFVAGGAGGVERGADRDFVHVTPFRFSRELKERFMFAAHGSLSM